MEPHGKQRAVVVTIAIFALLLAGCTIEERTATTVEGATSAGEIPGGADPADVEVIEAWVTTLAKGDIERAATYFALPSIAENGPLVLRIETLQDAQAFNESLPCGAKLRRAVPAGDFTEATFRLTERPGGNCGEGRGQLARTAFLIEDGEILEWRRIPTRTQPRVEGPIT